MITRETVRYVARLSRLALSQAEEEEFTNQLSRILDYVEKINELNTDDVEPIYHSVELKNVFREDGVKPSLPQKELERIAPEFEKGMVVVPKIIE